ncbi:hypothetical protein U1Q18_038019 [Sarracenia purpurea var. burkii]
MGQRKVTEASTEVSDDRWTFAEGFQWLAVLGEGSGCNDVAGPRRKLEARVAQFARCANMREGIHRCWWSSIPKESSSVVARPQGGIFGGYEQRITKEKTEYSVTGGRQTSRKAHRWLLEIRRTCRVQAGEKIRCVCDVACRSSEMGHRWSSVANGGLAKVGGNKQRYDVDRQYASKAKILPTGN